MKTKNLVLLEREEEVSLIILNDQNSFNSLSEGLLKDLFKVLKEADEDSSTKVLVLKGAGRGFSSGHNLKEVTKNQDKSFYRKLMASSKKVMKQRPMLLGRDKNELGISSYLQDDISLLNILDCNVLNERFYIIQLVLYLWDFSF